MIRLGLALALLLGMTGAALAQATNYVVNMCPNSTTKVLQVCNGTTDAGVPVSGTSSGPATTVSINQTTPGTTNGVVINSGTASITGTVAVQPVARTKVSTTAVAASKIIQGAAANLYHFEVVADSTLYAAEWWIMVFDATTNPGGGSVTPALCYDMPPLTRSYERGFASPVAFSTGIVISVSTTGCFTETNSTHAAFIEGDY